MRIIGILNHKGGTGKTTTVVNLAAGLAKQGKHVLCIDMDSQGSLATSLGISYTHSLADLLLDQATLAECIVSARPNLDLIASDAKLLDAEGYLWQLNDKRAARQLLSQKLTLTTQYDYVLLDYSPSLSLLGQSGLLYIRELIVPISMDYLALVGTRQVIHTLKEIGRIAEHRVKLSYVVPTFYYGRLRKDREIMQTLNHYFNNKVTRPIRANVKLAEAPGHQMSIYEYAPRSQGAKDYTQLVERLINYG